MGERTKSIHSNSDRDFVHVKQGFPTEIGGWVNQAYSRLSTTHGHITDCKLVPLEIDHCTKLKVKVWSISDLSSFDNQHVSYDVLVCDWHSHLYLTSFCAYVHCNSAAHRRPKVAIARGSIDTRSIPLYAS